MSSWWHNENPIIGPLQAANLEMLLLDINNGISQSSIDLSNLTFEGIEGIKIFSLTNDSYWKTLFSLPPSIQLLTNVRTLCLNRLKLGDISFVARLTRLEFLDLWHCEFNVLPYEIGTLTRLKLLDLSRCDIYRKTYNGALGRCSQLEVFYILPCIGEPFPIEKFVCEMVVDIGTLSKLRCFTIDNCFDRPSFSRNIMSRSLSLWGFNISKLRASKGNILKIAEDVAFTDLHGDVKISSRTWLDL